MSEHLEKAIQQMKTIYQVDMEHRLGHIQALALIAIAESLEKMADEPTREEVVQKTINEYIGQRQGGKALREFLHENADEYPYTCTCDEHMIIWTEKRDAERQIAKQAKEEPDPEPHITTDEMWSGNAKDFMGGK